MKIDHLLALGAARFPDHEAVIHGDRRITYRHLETAVNKVAAALADLKTGPGARGAILYENSINYVIFYFALIRAGWVVVPLDTSLRPDKLNLILKDCRAELLVFQKRFLRHLDRIIDHNDHLNYIACDQDVPNKDGYPETLVLDRILAGKAADGGGGVPAGYVDQSFEDLLSRSGQFPHEPAAIFYTSGSTGQSKGVVLSHRNLCSNTLSTVVYLELTPDDRIMVILPFYYIYGNSLLLTHILVGGTLVIDNRTLYPEVVLDTMEKMKVTGFSGVPSNFIIMLNKTSFPRRRLDKLRYLTQAGGAMAPEITRRLMEVCPDKAIYIMYGQTEAAPRVTYLPPEKLHEKLGSIGIPVPGIEVEVVDEDGQVLPVGKAGELVVRGDNVMLGYWNQPEETATVIRGGWLYTGDLARKDEDGYLFITGRKKEIIKTGGNRVSAKEVEECLLGYPRIMEAAVIGVPDTLLGETIKAFIVVRDEAPLTLGEIRSHCRGQLAEHKIPRLIETVAGLPKKQSGKVDKMKLKEMSAG